MILFRMVGDNEIDGGHTIQLFAKQIQHRRIDRVKQGCMGASFDEVGVVGSSVGKGDERVKQAPVPIDSAQPVDLVLDWSSFHSTPLL